MAVGAGNTAVPASPKAFIRAESSNSPPIGGR
jgi:hypothetical protein